MGYSTMLAATADDPLILSPFIYVFVFLFALIGALKGRSRGIKRQLVRTITVAIAAIASYYAVSIGYGYLEDFLSDKTMADVETWILQSGLVPSGMDTSWIASLDMATAEIILTLPVALIVMPFLFVACFQLLSWFMLIFHAIICAICGFKKKKNTKTTRLWGALLGMVQGIAVAGLFLLPLVGMGNIAQESVAILNEEAPNEEFTATVTTGYDAYVKDVAEDPVIKLYSVLGVNTLYESLATVELNDKEYDTTELVYDSTMITIDAVELKGADPKNLSAENVESIKAILDRIEQNSVMSEVLAGSFRSLSGAYESGVFNIQIDEPYKSIIDAAFEIFKTSDSTNINTDLDTVASVYFLLSDDGVLKAFGSDSEAMLEILTKRDTEGKTTINKIVSTVEENERTKPLITLITKISITVMADQAGIDETVVETFDNIKNGLNDNVLSINKEDFGGVTEEYKDAISDALDTTLKENNITLEKEIVDTMADFVADNFSDVKEISDELVTDIILSYYDAYVEYMENGTIPDGVIPDEIPIP